MGQEFGHRDRSVKPHMGIMVAMRFLGVVLRCFLVHKGFFLE